MSHGTPPQYQTEQTQVCVCVCVHVCERIFVVRLCVCVVYMMHMYVHTCAYMQSIFQCLLSSQHDVQAIPILTHGPESVDPSTLPPAVEVVHVRH